MTLTITDTTMTSDQTIHTARQAPDRNGWEVSWLPGQTLDRNIAITAMTSSDERPYMTYRYPFLYRIRRNNRLWRTLSRA